MEWIITGYSGKLDGFIYRCLASDEQKAVQRLLEHFEHDKLLECIHPYDHTPVRYLILKDSSWKPDLDDDEGPRHSGWQIFVAMIDNEGFANDAVCW